MAIIAYSSLYALSTDGRTYLPETAPVNQRLGDSIWINATVLVPAGSVAGSTVVIAPVVAGVRPVRAWFTNPQANASLDCDIGYTSSIAAISTTNVFTKTATTVSLTDTQLSAITVKPIDGDNLIITTKNASVTTAATWTVFVEFVNSGI